MRDPDPSQDELAAETEKRAERQRRAREAGEDSAARRLAQIGILGWMIVTPMLAGIFAGRWLDGRFGSGLTWTGALLMAGLALGCWSAWRWMHGR
ncbi:MAG: AtpZ/AtpI family protein [Amaricoccus sp.]